MLIVTTSWRRAETIRDVILNLGWRLFQPCLSAWITTFGDVEQQGVEAAIWRHVRDWANCRLLAYSAEVGSETGAIVL